MLVVVDDLEGDVEFVGDLVGIAFVHGFGRLVFEWVDEFQGGFASCPAFQLCAVDPGPGGVACCQWMSSWTRVQRFWQ